MHDREGPGLHETPRRIGGQTQLGGTPLGGGWPLHDGKGTLGPRGAGPLGKREPRAQAVVSNGVVELDGDEHHRLARPELEERDDLDLAAAHA